MKNLKILKLISTAILVFAIIFTTAGFRACQKKSEFRTAIDASYRLPAATNDLIDTMFDARDRGIITLEQSKKFGNALHKMAEAEKIYVKGVKALNVAINANAGQVDHSKLADLRILFDDQIVGPFLEVLQMVGVLSGDNASKVRFAIAAVRLLLTTIGGGIGSTLLQRLIGDNSPGNRPDADLAGGIFIKWSYA